jgi:predicted RecA/RadA family phage recombinase
MKNFVQPGESLTVASAAAQTAGNVFVSGKLFGVVANSTEANEDVVIRTCGVYDLAKDASTFALGALVYATAAGQATSTSAGNTLIGVSVKSAATGDTTVRTLLNESRA